MRRIPDMMARMLALRLSGTSANGGAARSANIPAAGAPSGSAPGSAAGVSRVGGGQWAGQGGAGGDPSQMLTRLPPIQIGDLKKGDAVMLVATDGIADFTAITLLAGVEPLLEAPLASQTLLNNWSMGSGAPDTGIQQ